MFQTSHTEPDLRHSPGEPLPERRITSVHEMVGLGFFPDEVGVDAGVWRAGSPILAAAADGWDTALR